jgi:hypothetical protein
MKKPKERRWYRKLDEVQRKLKKSAWAEYKT